MGRIRPANGFNGGRIYGWIEEVEVWWWDGMDSGCSNRLKPKPPPHEPDGCGCRYVGPPGRTEKEEVSTYIYYVRALCRRQIHTSLARGGGTGTTCRRRQREWPHASFETSAIPTPGLSSRPPAVHPSIHTSCRYIRIRPLGTFWNPHLARRFAG